MKSVNISAELSGSKKTYQPN